MFKEPSLVFSLMMANRFPPTAWLKWPIWFDVPRLMYQMIKLPSVMYPSVKDGLVGGRSRMKLC